MGFYIEGPTVGKAAYLVKEHGAELTNSCMLWEDIPDGKAAICVVLNGAWDAAAYCFSEKEFDEWHDFSDPRPKTWLLMDKSKAKELSNCSL